MALGEAESQLLPPFWVPEGSELFGTVGPIVLSSGGADTDNIVIVTVHLLSCVAPLWVPLSSVSAPLILWLITLTNPPEKGTPRS